MYGHCKCYGKTFNLRGSQLSFTETTIGLQLFWFNVLQQYPLDPNLVNDVFLQPMHPLHPVDCHTVQGHPDEEEIIQWHILHGIRC